LLTACRAEVLERVLLASRAAVRDLLTWKETPASAKLQVAKGRPSMRSAALLLVALVASTALADDSVKKLDGQLAPDLGAVAPAAGPRVTDLARLRGKLVYVVFFSPVDTKSQRDATKLEALWQKHRDRGLIVLGVSEDGASVLADFAQNQSVTYPIVSAPQAFKTYGISGYPRKYLVSPRGYVVDSSIETDEALVASELDRMEGWPKSDYSKKFDPVIKLLRAGDMAKASASLQKITGDRGAEPRDNVASKDAKDVEDAKALLDWIDEEGGRRLASGDELLAKGQIFDARDAWSDLEKHWPKTAESVKKAGEKLAALKADATAKKVLAVEKTWQDAQAAEGRDQGKAAALYVKCAKATAGTPFAELCEKKAKELDGKLTNSR
jgi:peroxiredoxin